MIATVLSWLLIFMVIPILLTSFAITRSLHDKSLGDQKRRRRLNYLYLTNFAIVGFAGGWLASKALGLPVTLICGLGTPLFAWIGLQITNRFQIERLEPGKSRRKSGTERN
jgi:hypothetical protein